MEENDQLQKYIFHEDLYIIAEPEQAILKEPMVEEKSIAIEQEDDTSKVEEGREIVYLGDNEQGILILVNDPESEYLNQKELKFLLSIVEAGLKYTKKDFALVNCAVFPQKEILEEVRHSYLIAFGLGADSSEEKDAYYQIVEENGKKLLYGEKLSTIEADVVKKKLLWKALKNMFDIKNQ